MSTISQWTVTYLMHSTLLIAVVTIAAYVLRSASARDTLWKLALLGAFVTATVHTMVPARNTITVEPRAIESSSRQVFEGLLVDSTTRRLEDSSRSTNPTSYVPFAYAAIAIFLLGRIVVGRRRFLAQIADRVELAPTPELAAHRIRLSESRAIGSPVAMLGREIVMPADVPFTDEQRETILAHELAHLLRRDPLWLTVAEVVKAVFFIQPLHWLVAAKMKETAEFLCDDAAVLRTQNPKALAETLAELAAHAGPASPAVAAMAENGSNLIARVTRVLRSHPRLPLTRRVRAAIAATVIGTTVLFAPGFGIARTTHTGKSWSGRVELTGKKDHVPTHLTIDIRNIRFDEHSGRIEISGNDGLDVVERLGDSTRTFTLRRNKSAFSGSWVGGESPEEWLRRLLVEQTKSDPRMVEAVLNY